MHYDRLTQNALRGVVRAALDRVAAEGLPGDHHFYISFKSFAPNVVMPEYLRQLYPDEMTIVLKKHFWELDVTDDGFAVGVSFNQQPEKLSIPWAAIVRFYDPAVEFGLAFSVEVPGAPPPDPEPDHDDEDDEDLSSGEVVSLDAFRNR